MHRFAAAAALAVLVAVIPAAYARTVADDDADECARLAHLSIADTTIESAQSVPAGPFMAPDPAKIGPWYTHSLGALVGEDARMAVPAFCRVAAVIRPTPESHIGVEVWLPQPSAWNGKLLGTGNAGSAGVIAYPFLEAGIQRGYATANTDMGTGAPNVSDLAFGVGHPELVVDYAYRATHLMTTAAKALVNAYYERAARLSYFAGCSTGGHQGLVEANRYPDDYDGIVAGDPDTSIESSFMGVWSYAVSHVDPGALFTPSQVASIAPAVMKACDGVDGLVDGVIDDPRRCHFDPASLECAGGHAPDCLTAAQVTALRRIYDGIRNPRTGALAAAGLEPGTEDAPVGIADILTMPTRPQPPVGYARWARSWKGPGFDWDTDFAAVVKELGPILSAHPDLAAFGRRGGRLLVYSGWADPAEPPRGIVDYFEAVGRSAGGAPPFARLFMVPGMSHCAGGTNVSYFDSLGALERWVEDRATPDALAAARVSNGVVTRTRPICAYPQVARWTGRGSTDRAENFRCVAPPG